MVNPTVTEIRLPLQHIERDAFADTLPHDVRTPSLVPVGVLPQRERPLSTTA